MSEKRKYAVKATVELIVETEISGTDHKDVKVHLKEKLIREGFSHIEIKYITSTVIADEEE